jgi:hypothetical protein
MATATKTSAAKKTAASKTATAGTGTGTASTATRSAAQTPESMARRDSTRASNASLNIDYESGRTPESFSTTGRTSVWVTKLNVLADDALAGRAQFDTFYQIGSFSTPGTAQSTIKDVRDNRANQLNTAVEFELKSDRSKTGSTLWAAVFRPAGGEGDGGDGGDDAWETSTATA